jgi:hypothetical protein
METVQSQGGSPGSGSRGCGSDATDDELAGLPIMLKVEEAARVLRIGRTLAYDLATRFAAGDPGGLPIVRVGACLRVPRWALLELIRHGRVSSDLHAAVEASIERGLAAEKPAGSAVRRQRATATGAQLSLLEHDGLTSMTATLPSSTTTPSPSAASSGNPRHLSRDSD